MTKLVLNFCGGGGGGSEYESELWHNAGCTKARAVRQRAERQAASQRVVRPRRRAAAAAVVPRLRRSTKQTYQVAAGSCGGCIILSQLTFLPLSISCMRFGVMWMQTDLFMQLVPSDIASTGVITLDAASC
jgi:hypothetical protein